MSFVKLSVYPNDDIGNVDIIVPISLIDHIVEVDESCCTVFFKKRLKAFDSDDVFCYNSINHIYKELDIAQRRVDA